METEEYQSGWRSHLQGYDDSENPHDLYNYDWHAGYTDAYLQHNRAG